ncbi:hypothetical protein SAMN05660845_0723 [Flavobacterium swingsii]|jgi:hypothetical protein|uniref:Outermembrane protein n=1 Tax=Flavobacterium swingsii TaxID=498292 RepID=A0A1I0WDV2_9FLAO|nr:hypothetical protein [Flavobacterium swingsii]SFA86935.1 hypothetical protein SAMN05660845_0723 [Flavobacterium swingsii]
MKKTVLIAFLISSFIGFSQNTEDITPEKYTAHNKGKFYIYWGGNRDSFSKSDIHFTGADYDFTLYDVTAQDKPKGWHVDYINPARMTIPQTNFRLGYYITDKYNISIGVDHMKYVMFQDKAVNYTGYYPNQGSYGESLPNNQVLLTEDFLTFEHTDGLNYVNTEFSRVDDISKFIGLPNTDKFQINFTEGVGVGLLYPKTNAKLLGKERHDDFHISGYGLSAKAGLNFTFFKYFFIQTELKGGYINMNDIKTTFDNADKATQKFWFLERTFTVGGIFRL